MSLSEVLLMAVGLAMDCFAVSLGIGTTQYARGRRPLFRLSFHFGLFQALMPALGWLMGRQVAGLVSGFDHWLAFGLLAFVAVRMIRSGLNTDVESHPTDPSRGGTLIMLAVATSIDAFAIGLKPGDARGANLVSHRGHRGGHRGLVVGRLTTGASTG